MRQWYVGVDGGGTKTAVAIAAADGVPVQTITYPTCSYQSVGIPESAALLTKAIESILAVVSGSPEDCAGCCIGMPCYGENPKMDRELVQRLTTALAPIPLRVVNDGEVGWAGSLECGEGIHIVSGTGSIAFGRGCDRKFARCGGWVEFFGDEGSCYWVGREAMSLFSKEADGRAPRGALYEVVRQEFRLETDYQLIDQVIRDIAPHRDKVAAFQRYALRAAQEGDLSAVQLYERAAGELALMVQALLSKLQFSKSPVSVSYSGGIFHAGELILTPLRRETTRMNCTLQEPKYSAIEGALMLAIEQFPPS